jgi:hypothetical protein
MHEITSQLGDLDAPSGRDKPDGTPRRASDKEEEPPIASSTIGSRNSISDSVQPVL